MPLIMLCGLPSSGKTYRAKQILAYLEARIHGPQDDAEVQDGDDANARRAMEAAINVSKKDFTAYGQKIESTNGHIYGVQQPTSAMPLTADALASTADGCITTADLANIKTASDGTLPDDQGSPPSSSLTASVTGITTADVPNTSSTFQRALPLHPVPATTSNLGYTKKPKLKSALTFHHISDHTLHIPRSAYNTSRTEKTARASIYSAVKRALGRDAVVVLDSGNYIKGWRYQLYCEAKAMGTPSCVVYVGLGVEKARELNALRIKAAEEEQGNNAVLTGSGTKIPRSTNEHSSQNQVDTIPDSAATTAALNSSTFDGSRENDPYDPTSFDELASRFEEPNGMSRWDSPLYTVVWEDVTPPLERIWEEIVNYHVQGPNRGVRAGLDASRQGVGGVGSASTSGNSVAGGSVGGGGGRGGGFVKGGARVIRPHQATVLPPSAPSNALHALDRATQHVVSHISAYLQQQSSPASSLSPRDTLNDGISIPIPTLTSTFGPKALASAPAATKTGALPSHTARNTDTTNQAQQDSSSPQDQAQEEDHLLIHLPANAPFPTFPQLQRMRRQFITLQRQQTGGVGVLVGGSGRRGGLTKMEKLFVEWLNDAFDT